MGGEHCTPRSLLRQNIKKRLPSIAQLVERRTVGDELISLGRWFESGSKESFSFFFYLNIQLARSTFKVFYLSIHNSFH